MILLPCIAYASSLAGGWLDYDDDWLIRDNPLLSHPTLSVARAILFDLGADTRITLGAEYLPVRDLAVAFTHGVLGLGPPGLRVVMLVVYVASLFPLRVWLRRWLASPVHADVVTLLFALHPVHVESVAWLAGMKDVLALLATFGALALWSDDVARRRWLAVPVVALAVLSKSMAVVTPLLFLLHDVHRRRPVAWGPWIAATVVTAALAALQVHVGAVVHMVATPLGGDRLLALASMLPVLVRYVGLSFLLVAPSVRHDVPVHAWTDLAVLASLVAVVAGVAVSLRPPRVAPSLRPALALFAIALAPVSQVIAPLQNAMADRYLYVALLGPLVVFVELAAALTARARPALQATLVALTLATLAALSGMRAATFTDPVALFADATDRTELDSVAPYNLGRALEARGRLPEAAAAYDLALRRDGFATDTGRRAGNNLAILLANAGQLEPARALYAMLRQHYPEHPRLLFNAITIERRLGHDAEADQLDRELDARFPRYREERRAGDRGPH